MDQPLTSEEVARLAGDQQWPQLVERLASLHPGDIADEKEFFVKGFCPADHHPVVTEQESSQGSDQRDPQYIRNVVS